MFREVDHIAVVVRNTDDALTFYRDQIKLPVLFSEVIESAGVRLTHLDMGNVRLQLVQPLTDDHPLTKHLEERGEGFHHVCWKVEGIDEAISELADFDLEPNPNEPHSAPNGGRAAFINPSKTRGVLWEMTGQ
ncbi:MAG: VOC family protein [Planctomycetaceae bacterium]